jgi:quercetin dioxygenase-like cupin family protein
LPVLARIAHALEVSLAEILRSSGSARLAHGRIGDAAGTERLAAEGSRLQIVRHAADAEQSGRAPLRHDAGDVFIYLYQGRLEIVVDDGVFELGPGDALHCDRPKTITWRSCGEERAVTIWVSGADPRSR